MSEDTNILLQHFLRELKQVQLKNEELQQKLYSTPKNYSIELGELYGALAKAQSTMEVAGCNRTNPFLKTKYSDLKDIIKASRKSLAANNLSVTQSINRNDNGQLTLTTILGHASGQFISSELPLNPPKSDPQSLGSYISYMRRYAYASLCGVVSGDEDDDAEEIMTQAREVAPKLNKRHQPKDEPYEFVSQDQIKELEFELEGYDDIYEEVLEKMKLNSLADMPKSRFLTAVKRIREIKQAREGK